MAHPANGDDNWLNTLHSDVAVAKQELIRDLLFRQHHGYRHEDVPRTRGLGAMDGALSSSFCRVLAVNGGCAPAGVGVYANEVAYVLGNPLTWMDFRNDLDNTQLGVAGAMGQLLCRLGVEGGFMMSTFLATGVLSSWAESTALHHGFPSFLQWLNASAISTIQAQRWTSILAGMGTGLFVGVVSDLVRWVALYYKEHRMCTGREAKAVCAEQRKQLVPFDQLVRRAMGGITGALVAGAVPGIGGALLAAILAGVATWAVERFILRPKNMAGGWLPLLRGLFFPVKADFVPYWDAGSSTPLDWQDQLPRDIICCITHQPLVEPVFAASTAQVYERWAIEAWLLHCSSQRLQLTCPSTGKVLNMRDLQRWVAGDAFVARYAAHYKLVKRYRPRD